MLSLRSISVAILALVLILIFGSSNSSAPTEPTFTKDKVESSALKKPS